MELPNQTNWLGGSIGCHYSSLPIEELLADDCVLAVLEFSQSCRATGCARKFSTGLDSLEDSSVKEVWYSSIAVEYGINNGLYWSASDDTLFVGMWVSESEYASLRTATHFIYAELINFVRQRRYPNIVRMWNYFADINVGKEDDERYKQFCLGRHDAFDQCGYQPYPAATAIGHLGGDMMVYLLASRTNNPLFFENPQQLSAYHYPREYGPRSPSFARAALMQEQMAELTQSSGKALLYLSGTASVKGHQSFYKDDFERQWTLTWKNIEALLVCVSDRSSSDSQLLMLKVYLREVRHLAQAKRLIKHYVNDDVEVLYLQGDICRSELLLEIDGVGLLTA